MKKSLVLALASLTGFAWGDVVIENPQLRLVIGDDAVTKSLTVKANGAELVDNPEKLPFVTVTQDRPFNNGSSKFAIALDRPESVKLAGMRYFETELSRETAKAAWFAAVAK